MPFLAAPVVGTRPHAEGGQLVYLVGGNEAVLREAEDVLSVLGANIQQIGSPSMAMAMKPLGFFESVDVTAWANDNRLQQQMEAHQTQPCVYWVSSHRVVLGN